MAWDEIQFSSHFNIWLHFCAPMCHNFPKRSSPARVLWLREALPLSFVTLSSPWNGFARLAMLAWLPPAFLELLPPVLVRALLPLSPLVAAE